MVGGSKAHSRRKEKFMIRKILLNVSRGRLSRSLQICLPLAGAFQATAQKELDVFLLIGQSNMSGRGVMIASDSLTPIASTWLFKDSLTWEPARNPLNRYSTLEAGSAANQVGPGFGFATEMLRLLPGKEFGLVVNARGGSSIVSWAKGTQYYKDALTRARQAGKAGKLKGILWHQGETDKGDAAYLDKLVGLMESLRMDLGDTALPVIAGQIGQFDASHAAFNARILKLPERLAHSAVVKSDGLVDRGDRLHFDRASQITLGKRYAAAAMALVYRGSTTGMRNANGPVLRHECLPSRTVTLLFPRKGTPAGENGFSDALGRIPGPYVGSR
jgi:hypothetical protein